MSFEYLTNIQLEKAVADYISSLENSGFACKTETIPVASSCGRITADAVRAHICAPHYSASAMDGVAVNARSTFGATDTTPVTLKPDQYIVVDTGDPVPEGCDAVIMVEDIVKSDDGSITIHSPAAPWQHIRQIGEDICAGEMILISHEEITPAAIGSMIAGGIMEVEVIKKPVVGIIPTGDEIVKPTCNPKPGEILEFNSSIFSSMLEGYGCSCVVYPIVKDKFDEISAVLEKASCECDIVIINAGSSAGRDDYSTTAIKQMGEVVYHGIAIKPGKPAILGHKGEKPILGVPGYPVSGIIVIEQILKPVIEEWYGTILAGRTTARAILARPVVSSLKYKEFVRCRLGYVNDKLIASPLNRGAGVVSSFMKADGMLVVDQNSEGFAAGDKVTVELMSSLYKLKNTIVAIGSHDPLLDELGDIIHQINPKLHLSSAHVGSMGGIMAIKRGEAHVAGCHLLDTVNGEYNLSYMRKYFPDRNVKLVRCVGRQQGLMIKKGNPLGIQSIVDITKENISYVNRQKGSGTRILLDYLLEKEGIKSSDIYGYEREEMTHTSVAAQIAMGSADVGLGIYSACQLYDLDFIPICIEEYDLIIPDYAYETEIVSSLLEALKSDVFRERLNRIGGYTLTDPGEIIDW